VPSDEEDPELVIASGSRREVSELISDGLVELVEEGRSTETGDLEAGEEEEVKGHARSTRHGTSSGDICNKT